MPLDPSIPLTVQMPKVDVMGQLGQIREQRQLEQLRAQQIRGNQAIEAQNRLETERARRAEGEQDTLSRLMQEALEPNEDGVLTFNRQTLQTGAIKANLGHRWPTIAKQLDEADTATASYQKRQREADADRQKALGALAVGVREAGNDPNAFMGAAATALANKLATREQLQPLIDAVQAGATPADVQKITDRLIAQAYPEKALEAQTKRNEPYTLNQGDVRIGAGGQVIARGEPKPEPVPTGFDAAILAATRAGNQRDVDRLIALKARAEAAGRKPDKPDTSTLDRGRLVQAVLANPSLWDDLTPTEKGKIAPDLHEQGYTGFGKALPPAAVTAIATTKSAVDNLKDLKTAMKDAEGYMGPIGSLQALNPWSDARKLVAKVDAVRQRVGKALEGGVLRKEDEEKYKAILAELSNTPELAYSKIDGMVSMLENDVKNYLAELRLSGRRVNTTPEGRPGSEDEGAPPPVGRGAPPTGRGASPGLTYQDYLNRRKQQP
jgi:hypothetical protein